MDTADLESRPSTCIFVVDRVPFDSDTDELPVYSVCPPMYMSRHWEVGDPSVYVSSIDGTLWTFEEIWVSSMSTLASPSVLMPNDPDGSVYNPVPWSFAKGTPGTEAFPLGIYSPRGPKMD